MSGSSYSMALEVAGAIVHDCRWFGSYQGDWIAHVTLPGGQTGIIAGHYGSCSGCDAFEAEFGYDSHSIDHEDGTSEYHSVYGEFHPACDRCQEYRERLRAFGEAYFSDFLSIEDMAQSFLLKSYWSDYDDDIEQAEFVLGLLPDDSPLIPEVRAHIRMMQS